MCCTAEKGLAMNSQRTKKRGGITAKREQGTKLIRKIEIPRENCAYQDGESAQRRNGKRLWDKAKFRVTEVPSK